MSNSFASPFRFIQSPIELFDYWMPILGHVQLKVLMFVIRKTFGWHKTSDRISISQMVEGVKSNRSNVCDAVKELVELGILKKEVIGPIGEQQTYYEIIVENKISYTSPSNDTPPSPPITTPPRGQLVPTKETLTKYTNTKELPTSPTSPKEDLAFGAGRKEPIDQKRKEVAKLPNPSLEEKKSMLSLLSSLDFDVNGKDVKLSEAQKTQITRNHTPKQLDDAIKCLTDKCDRGEKIDDYIGLFFWALKNYKVDPKEEEAIAYAREIKSKYNLKSLEIGPGFVLDASTGKDVCWHSLDIDSFKKACYSAFVRPLEDIEPKSFLNSLKGAFS